jgi:hypothetical protein
MVLKNRLKYSKVIILIVLTVDNSLYIVGLDKNIDGDALMRLTDNDISQLFLEVNEDGTIQEPTIGIKSRFRTKLMQWKMNNTKDE